MQRQILAIAAILSLVGAVLIWLWQPEMETTLSFCSRMGAVLTAAWLAYDDVQRLSGWLLLMLPAFLIVVVRWPRLLLVLIPALVFWAILRKTLSRG